MDVTPESYATSPLAQRARRDARVLALGAVALAAALLLLAAVERSAAFAALALAQAVVAWGLRRAFMWAGVLAAIEAGAGVLSPLYALARPDALPLALAMLVAGALAAPLAVTLLRDAERRYALGQTPA